MEEKVLHVSLPKGAKYRRVIVTEDGKVGIVYSVEDTNKSVISEENTNVEVKKSKPERLVGGTEVYQKEAIPYWYCKIKNGRDEFMYLSMEDLTENDLLYDSNGEPRQFTTWQQKGFKMNVLKALENKPEKGYCWIPAFEPVTNEEGKIQFVKGEKPLVEQSSSDWEKMLEEYSPENHSCMASDTTYFLLLLRWLKDGFANVGEMTNYSTSMGHFCNSKNAKHDLELTGDREFGGLYGFVGNTCKLVKSTSSESGYFMMGGSYHSYGIKTPLAHVRRVNDINSRYDDTVGLLELKG